MKDQNHSTHHPILHVHPLNHQKETVPRINSINTSTKLNHNNGIQTITPSPFSSLPPSNNPKRKNKISINPPQLRHNPHHHRKFQTNATPTSEVTIFPEPPLQTHTKSGLSPRKLHILN